MKQEIKEKWVAALRSGEYKQGKDVLLYEGKYCCLGVLCDIHRKETDKGVWTQRDERFKDTHYVPTNEPEDADEHNLPMTVKSWAGLKYTSPYVLKGSDYVGLTNLNDSDGLSFSQIADLIEADPNI